MSSYFPLFQSLDDCQKPLSEVIFEASQRNNYINPNGSILQNQLQNKISRVLYIEPAGNPAESSINVIKSDLLTIHFKKRTK